MTARPYERVLPRALSQLPFKRPASIRIRGLPIAVELDSEGSASRAQGRCRRGGLLVTTEGAGLLLVPALDIEQPVAERGLDILQGCV